MAKVPVKFKKMSAMLNEAARMRFCESSGSEHYSPENSADDLSDLVNSFIESTNTDVDTAQSNNTNSRDDEDDDSTRESQVCLAETNRKLVKLLNKHEDENDMRNKIRAQTEIACGIIGETSPRSHGFKRKLMSHLRELGIDAGICKTRWERFERHPSGEYEFVEVNAGGQRLIVEVCIAAEFEIARPSSNYTALLDVLPRVFIGRPKEMKEVVSLMCSAIRKSMKEMRLHVPPWRKNAYMQNKWGCAFYKRTVSEAAASKRPDEAFPTKRSLGFEVFPVKTYRCGGAVGKFGLKLGHLAAAFHE
ncbi:uncharacterized protein LOC126665624 [Mercurialis annua]|uniref:uncharacterized protein LOC126665624 n=1 Tax=Mercurialis annua TaxID=3986 RepID=UPI00215EE047|nr:uncharacterized protein LOC126665624 [Mercurialis annua]